MSQIERATLEKPTPLNRAICILNEFLYDPKTYSDNDFYFRKGICKVLAEEYLPLVRLAQGLIGVRNIHLLSNSNPGPDAKISFWWRKVAPVQITCANEDYDRALMREQMLSGKSVLPQQKRKRDKVTGSIVTEGDGTFALSADVQFRIDRIFKAITSKECNYYTSTEILIVQESPFGYKYLQESHLHEQVCQLVLKRDSQYKQIYVNYGDRLKRVK